MKSYWGVEHGEVAKSMVHLPDAKPAALEGRVVSHAGKRTGFHRTGPRKPPGGSKIPKNPVADGRGIAEGRYSWKRAGRNVAIAGGAGGALGAYQSKYNSDKPKRRQIKNDGKGVASLAAYGGTVALAQGLPGAAATTAAVGGAGAYAGYKAGRSAADAYLKRKKK